jgi:hypothetical protein
MKISSADVAAATLAVTLNKVLDFVKEPLDRLDFDDFERGEATMAASIFWIINDNLGIGEVYGASTSNTGS